MTDLQSLFGQRLDGSLSAIASLRAQLPKIVGIAQAIGERLSRSGTIHTCGNGGSAAEALHLAEELIGRYRSDRPPRRAVCLNADPTALTCIANDFGFEAVFARQCDALLDNNDALVVFSTSGDSENIVQALHAAKRREAITIGLLGKDGGRCLGLCDLSLVVACKDSAHIQEAHQVALHLICESLET